MSYNETNPHNDSRNQTCGYCGAVFYAMIIRQSGHNDWESYSCPECKKSYDVRASMPIFHVSLISPRTDRRKDMYSEND